jgi:hypothetical protein
VWRGALGMPQEAKTAYTRRLSAISPLTAVLDHRPSPRTSCSTCSQANQRALLAPVGGSKNIDREKWLTVQGCRICLTGMTRPATL